MVGEVAETTSGGTPDRGAPDYYGGGIPWVKSGELRDGNIRRTSETLTDKGLASSNARIFPSGTLLMAMYGATAGMLGDLDGSSCDESSCMCSDSDERGSDYLYYALLMRRSALLSERIGGAQPNLSQRLVRAFSIPIPPRDEQDRIATLLCRLDRWLDAMSARTAALERIFASTLATLFGRDS